MSIDVLQLEKLYRINATMLQHIPPHIKVAMPDPFRGSFPDYGKSLVAQNKQNPVMAGVRRGTTTGVTGGVLAAIIARLLTANKAVVGGAGLAGAALGGTAGYVSGSREAASEHTRNLALRRLGINNPAEMYVLNRSPELTKRMTEKGVYL